MDSPEGSNEVARRSWEARLRSLALCRLRTSSSNCADTSGRQSCGCLASRPSYAGRDARHPQLCLPAASAWLAGSTVTGTATATSDLDITVLLADTDDVHRESLTYQGWPVEVFVHTQTSIRHFVHADTQRRRPTMARMVATGNPLLPGPSLSG